MHMRLMGLSQQGALTGPMGHGFGHYLRGTGLLYVSASAVFRMSRPLDVTGSLAIWWSSVRASLRRKQRFGYPGFRALLNRHQWRALLLGRLRAAKEAESTYASRWTGASGA